MRGCASPYASANQLIGTAGIRKADAHGPNNAGTQYTPLKEQFVHYVHSLKQASTGSKFTLNFHRVEKQNLVLSGVKI